ncbi:hypothetical protein LTR41_004746 [Exophiala xenobiotica]|nr:hypothetical protein LTR41_004746 [Exophiala xenobiotica]
MNDRSAEQQGLPGIERPAGQVIHITYRIRERGEWRIAHTLDMDPSDTSEVERLAVKYMRKRIRVFDSNLNILTPRNCFEAATTDGKNTVLLIPESDINIGREIEASVADLASDARLNDETVQKKRIRQ